MDALGQKNSNACLHPPWPPATDKQFSSQEEIFFIFFLDSFEDFVCLIFDKVRINVPPDLLMSYSLLMGLLSHLSRWMNSFYR